MHQHETIAVAMSGGVDSSTVAAILAQGRGRLRRITAEQSSASLSSFGTRPVWPASTASPMRPRRAAAVPWMTCMTRAAWPSTWASPTTSSTRKSASSRMWCGLCGRVPGRPNADSLLALQQPPQVRPVAADCAQHRRHAHRHRPLRGERIRPRARFRAAAGFSSAPPISPRIRRTFSSASPRSSCRALCSRWETSPSREVREVARQRGLTLAEKPDSQEICFIPGGDYKQFLTAYLEEQGRPMPETAGELVASNGEVLGRHEGISNFTVGQRKGLKVASPSPLYVLQIDPASHRVTVGADAELATRTLRANRLNWISIPALTVPCESRSRFATATSPPGQFSSRPAPAQTRSSPPSTSPSAPSRPASPPSSTTAMKSSAAAGSSKLPLCHQRVAAITRHHDYPRRAILARHPFWRRNR